MGSKECLPTPVIKLRIEKISECPLIIRLINTKKSSISSWNKNPIKYRKIQKTHRNTEYYRDLNKKYQLKRRKNNPYLVLRSRIQRLVNHAIKNNNPNYISKKFQEIIGYPIIELKKNIESKFKKDMSWDNYNLWQVDHIIPQSLFDLDSIKQCWSMDNIQPLWKIENLQKGKKSV